MLPFICLSSSVYLSVASKDLAMSSDISRRSTLCLAAAWCNTVSYVMHMHQSIDGEWDDCLSSRVIGPINLLYS